MNGSRRSGDSIRRNAVLSLVNQLTSAVFTAVLTIYLTHELGPKGYGLFGLAVSVGALAALLADFGVSGSAARFVADHDGDRRGQAAVITRALRLKLVLILGVSAALIVLAGPISEAYGLPILTWPLRGAAIALAGQSLMLFVTNVLAALRRVAANLPVVLSESAVEATASIVLVALGGGATGAAFGRAIGFGVGGVLTIVVLSRVLGRNVLRHSHRAPDVGRRIARYAFPVFMTSTVWTVFTQIDAVLLGALAGSGAVGAFQAASRLSSVFGYAGTAMSAGVSPRVAVQQGGGDRAFARAVRYLILGHAIVVAPLVVWAEPIVRLLLGSAFGDSVAVVQVGALYVFLNGLGPLLTVSVDFLGGAGRRVPIALAALGANTAVDVLLIPGLGALGAAIGMNVGYLVYLPPHFWMCRRELGFELRPVAMTLLRATLAAAAMAAVLAAAGIGRLSPAGWVLGGAGGVLAYLVVLLATGEIKRVELAAVAAGISRRVTERRRTTRP